VQLPVLLLCKAFTIVLLQSVTAFPVNQQPTIPKEIPVEVIQVLDLPLTISHATLVKTKDGYQLKCDLTNNSEFKVLGLRLSVSLIDALNEMKPVINHSESFRLPASQTSERTFTRSFSPRLKPGERLVLLPEQVMSAEYVWDVVNTQEVWKSYLNSDFSKPPRVIRSSNYTDAPINGRVIY